MVYSLLSSCWRFAAETFDHWTSKPDEPYVILQSPENLRKAIREKGIYIFDYKFKRGEGVYSSTNTPMEYAIQINDKDSVREMFRFGVDSHQFNNTWGTLVHYYLNCLSADTPPDLEMLNLLLDHLKDINATDTTDNFTVLEHALRRMSSFKKIHWSVIEILLAKGVRITSESGTTPFSVLRDSHLGRGKERSLDEELYFLMNLADYLALEKKYHHESDSALTFEEFTFRAERLHGALWESTSELYRPAHVLRSYSFKPSLQNNKPLFKFVPLQEDIQEKIEAAFEKQPKLYELSLVKLEAYHSVAFVLFYAHGFFEALGVKERPFKEWVGPADSYVTGLTKVSAHSGNGQILLDLIEKWGISLSSSS